MLTPLEQAVAYYKDGDTEKAIQLLADLLVDNPRDENGWLWMSRCVTDPRQKKDCFEQLLRIDPHNEDALEGLWLLDDATQHNCQFKPDIMWQFIREKWLWILCAVLLIGLVLVHFFLPDLPRLIIASLGLNNSAIIISVNNSVPLDDLPEPIAGLDHALVRSYMSVVGVDCQPATAGWYGYMMVCSGGSPDESLDIYMEILSRRQTGEIYHLLGCVLQYEKNPSEYISGELLGYLARIPYTNADSARASVWVKRNISGNPLTISGEKSPGVVFGGVLYVLEGPVARGKCLSIGTEVNLP